jgi:hypothetical protein
MKVSYIILVIYLAIMHSSCMTLIGCRNIKVLSNNDIVKLAKRFNIPEKNLYIIKSKDFAEFIETKKLSKRDKQNIEQPNQILVFDSESNNITNLIDCNIGGFPILKWNRFRGFDSIPIRQGLFFTTPVFLSKNELDSLSIPLSSNNNSERNIHSMYHYYVLWSRVLFRNSKKMIKLINRNLKIAQTKNIQIEIKYIFSDSMFYE